MRRKRQYYTGAGDPNGVVTAAFVPAFYFDTTNETFWFKDADPGTNTGWTT